MMDYTQYLTRKDLVVPNVGIDVPDDKINPMLFPFQRHITRWALGKGRAAIFADCGLGKTPMQLEWAAQLLAETGDPRHMLIVCPLAVAEQTCREGRKFGVDIQHVRHADDMDGTRIVITNYERLHHFDPAAFFAIVIDESSILKSYDGKTKTAIIDFANTIPYRLACTATPAPNDYTELCNHAEFLGIMSEKEVKALFFTQDGNSTTNWRLKGHAVKDFWRWLASWSIAISSPRDLGYEDDGFDLPPLEIIEVPIDDEYTGDELFAKQAITLQEQRAASRATIKDRIEVAADIVEDDPDKAWLVWCHLNKESDALRRAIDGAVEIKGSDADEHKSTSMLGFSDGVVKRLVTKPSIAGFGMNWQHCNRVVFVDVDHSYERFYQAVRRVWRFGQTKPVKVYLVYPRSNQRIIENIKRKEEQARAIMGGIIGHLHEAGQGQLTMRQEMTYTEDKMHSDGWTLYLGDCVEVTQQLDDESIGLSVFSPPFPGMYVYTNSARDMGNTHDIPEMIEHMRFLVRPLLQKTMPGRHACIHLTQGTAQKMRDGYIGLRDFRGRVIDLMESEGWIYYGEVCIDKNPQVKAIRTKDRGLLFKTLAHDSAHMHMALADYVLQFRKPGDNPAAIAAGISERYKNDTGWISPDEWIRWARPVWYAQDWAPNDDGIQETDVLNVRQARETNDERHLAPLQLGVIERCIKLWSAPGDLVFDPFTGIGSTGYVAVRLGRRFVGSELKRSYFDSAGQNLRAAEALSLQGTLFAMVPNDPRIILNGEHGYKTFADPENL